MLDFLGFIVTAALVVLAVNAVMTFMHVSPSTGRAGRSLERHYAAAGSAWMVAIKKLFYINDLYWLCWQSGANLSLPAIGGNAA